MTGTFAGLIPVRTIDGRTIGDLTTRFQTEESLSTLDTIPHVMPTLRQRNKKLVLPGTMTQKLQELYIKSIEEETSHGRPFNMYSYLGCRLSLEEPTEGHENNVTEPKKRKIDDVIDFTR